MNCWEANPPPLAPSLLSNKKYARYDTSASIGPKKIAAVFFQHEKWPRSGRSGASKAERRGPRNDGRHLNGRSGAPSGYQKTVVVPLRAETLADPHSLLASVRSLLDLA
jgi:hypothetical protein